jgi:hypothetical protein
LRRLTHESDECNSVEHFTPPWLILVLTVCSETAMHPNAVAFFGCVEEKWTTIGIHLRLANQESRSGDSFPERMPCRIARATACVRDRALNRARISFTYHDTVLADMQSRMAISLSVLPSATSARIRSSRSERWIVLSSPLCRSSPDVDGLGMFAASFLLLGFWPGSSVTL